MKIMEGKIVSISEKTAIVEVYSKTPHPLYKKLIKRSKKFKADIAGQNVALGERVKIAEGRPISKDKHFRISEVVASEEDKNKKTRQVKSHKKTELSKNKKKVINKIVTSKIKKRKEKKN